MSAGKLDMEQRMARDRAGCTYDALDSVGGLGLAEGVRTYALGEAPYVRPGDDVSC